MCACSCLYCGKLKAALYIVKDGTKAGVWKGGRGFPFYSIYLCGVQPSNKECMTFAILIQTNMYF